MVGPLSDTAPVPVVNVAAPAIVIFPALLIVTRFEPLLWKLKPPSEVASESEFIVYEPVFVPEIELVPLGVAQVKSAVTASERGSSHSLNRQQ